MHRFQSGFVFLQAPGKILETGVNTLQRTLVLKKQVELDQVDRQLSLKHQEFKILIQTLSQRSAELLRKHQEVGCTTLCNLNKIRLIQTH